MENDSVEIDWNENPPKDIYSKPLESVFEKYADYEERVDAHTVKYCWLTDEKKWEDWNKSKQDACRAMFLKEWQWKECVVTSPEDWKQDEDQEKAKEEQDEDQEKAKEEQDERKKEDEKLVNKGAKEFWEGVQALFKIVGPHVEILTLRLADTPYLSDDIKELKREIVTRTIFESCPNLVALKCCGTWGDYALVDNTKLSKGLKKLQVLTIHNKAEGFNVMSAMTNTIYWVGHLSLYEELMVRFFDGCPPLENLKKLTLRSIGGKVRDSADLVSFFKTCPNLEILSLITGFGGRVINYVEFINGILEITKLKELITDDSIVGSGGDAKLQVRGLETVKFHWTTFDIEKMEMFRIHANVTRMKIYVEDPSLDVAWMKWAGQRILSPSVIVDFKPAN